MSWSIQQVARLAGTTSRTLRHDEQLGLLVVTHRAANGYRHYDEAALTRLQCILLLRDLGLGLPAIAEVLAGETDDARALATHLQWLSRERERIDRQIASVTTTIAKLVREEPLMPDEMLDGFDHTQYRDEVEQRWGTEAYAHSDRWWRELGPDGRADFQAEAAAIQQGFADARASGLAPDADEVQALAARHWAWVRAGWGGTPPAADAYVGLGDMYVGDPRFAAHYGGVEGAEFVRDAMRVYAEREL